MVNLPQRNQAFTDTVIQPKEGRFEAPIIIHALYGAWFSSPAAAGLKKETKDFYLPLSEKLILFTCTMIRWAIMNERDADQLGKAIRTRFEGDQVQCKLPNHRAFPKESILSADFHRARHL
jgi:hypothetical protein